MLPTHLYGMACDMDPILELARRHNLKVIEDCAHSLGAMYKGQMVGTLGDASFFSFQAFKPLNTYGGGLAWMRDADLARRVGELADGEAWPSEKRVESILSAGKWQHTFIRPKVFTYSLFPIWYAASWVNAKPEERLWERVRPLDPLPDALSRPVLQRAGGDRPGRPEAAAGVHRAHQAACAHAGRACSAMCPASRFRGLRPSAPTCTTRSCAYVPDSETIVKRCIRRGVDVAPMHVDVCTRMELFGLEGPAAPGAEKAADGGAGAGLRVAVGLGDRAGRAAHAVRGDEAGARSGALKTAPGVFGAKRFSNAAAAQTI